MKKLFMGAAAFALAAAVFVPLAPQSARADNIDRSVSVCNYRGSGYSDRIVHVYISEVSRNNWGRDMLDGHISVGDCRTLTTGASGGSCAFDYKAVDASGREWLATLNPCRLERWTLRS